VARHFICDGNGHCWTNEGSDADLALTGGTKYDTTTYYCETATVIGGQSEPFCEYESADGDCVTAYPGAYTFESACQAYDEYQEFWYTDSQAIYALGVSAYEGHRWCELDVHGDVQNTPCTAPDAQSAGETFFWT
jgi:hypothetical protein